MKGSSKNMNIVELHPELEVPVTRSLKCRHQGYRFHKNIRKIITAGLGLIWKSAMSLRSLRPEIRIMEGYEKYSNDPLSVIYVGSLNDIDFISGCLFSKVEVQNADASWWAIFNVRKWVAGHMGGVDLIVVDIGYPLSSIIRQDNSLNIPRWVKQRVKISDNWHEILKGMSRKRRREVSRYIRKYGFTWKTAVSGQACREFYSDIYKPYINRRFGNEAILVSEKKFMSECSMGTILQVYGEGKIWASNLLKYDGKQLSSGWVGYVCDKDAVPHKGVSDVLDYYTLVHAYINGCVRLDLGSSRALTSNGVFQYKKKWGAYIENSRVPQGDIQIRPMRFTDAVKSVLCNNGFIVRDGRRLIVKILLMSGRVSLQELKQQIDEKQTKGLASMKVYALEGFETEAEQWARSNPDLLTTIDLSLSDYPERDFCAL